MRAKQFFKRRGRAEQMPTAERAASSACIEPLEQRRMMSVSITRTTDHNVQLSAGFDSLDPTGTVETAVTVNATADIDATNGKIVANTAEVDLLVSISNSAVGYFVTLSEGISTSQSIVVAPNLQAAHVTAVVPLVDLTGQPFQANVNVWFKPTDALQTNVTKIITMSGPGIVVVDKSFGDSADAVATGVVALVDTQSFAPVPNATPLPSFAGSMGNHLDSTTTITVTIPPKWKFLFPSFGTNSIQLDSPDELSKLTGM